MLQIYGFPLSSPCNKVIYVANYLNMKYEYHAVNLGAGDHRKPEYLKINPLGKIPAIDDNGFTLGESNAIIRYLASKENSAIYPTDLKQRAIVDQWMDYASQHISIATGKIIFNTFFYKFSKIEKDERSLQDGLNYLNLYLPKVEAQLQRSAYIAGSNLSLADFSLLASLDVCELCKIDLNAYPALQTWRNKMMHESFYTNHHTNYAESFNKILGNAAS